MNFKHVLKDIPGHVYFEFAIPRMGKRVDVVLISGGIIFVIEFKVGETTYPAYALEQVMDYALDLKNFHSSSHHSPIVPILVCTEAIAYPLSLQAYPDRVYEPLRTNGISLGKQINECLLIIHSIPIAPNFWEAGQYKPTPTIIQAAQALYRGHNVNEISRSEAGAENLSSTSDAIDNIIEYTKRNNTKTICFITGSPRCW